MSAKLPRPRRRQVTLWPGRRVTPEGSALSPDWVRISNLPSGATPTFTKEN